MVGSVLRRFPVTVLFIPPPVWCSGSESFHNQKQEVGCFSWSPCPQVTVELMEQRWKNNPADGRRQRGEEDKRELKWNQSKWRTISLVAAALSMCVSLLVFRTHIILRDQSIKACCVAAWLLNNVKLSVQGSEMRLQNSVKEQGDVWKENWRTGTSGKKMY